MRARRLRVQLCKNASTFVEVDDWRMKDKISRWEYLITLINGSRQNSTSANPVERGGRRERVGEKPGGYRDESVMKKRGERDGHEIGRAHV